jgi:hypothetical protein
MRLSLNEVWNMLGIPKSHKSRKNETIQCSRS